MKSSSNTRKLIAIITCIFFLAVSVTHYKYSLGISNGKAVIFGQPKRALTPEVDTTYQLQIKEAKDVKTSLTSETIELNQGSSLYKHIISIEHIPSRRRIRVNLRPDSRCPRPSFVGRLSGKTLFLIEWDPILEVEPEDPKLITGRYSVPAMGQYFIEIIIIYCKEPNDIDDLNHKVVEQPEYHRLTAFGARIMVRNSDYMQRVGRGYWEAPIETPLYTRWQPQNCRGEFAKEERCTSRTSLKPFEKYKFRWNSFQDAPDIRHIRYGDLTIEDIRFIRQDEYLSNCATDLRSSPCQICTVGASHSRRIFRYLEAIRVTGVGYFEFLYPRQVTAENAREIMDACPIILFGFGQWSASGNSRDTPRYYRDQMRNMLKLFLGHPKVYVRDVHNSPLGDLATHQPARDFRTPPIIERYNRLVKELCKEMGVHYVSSAFITKPMWDTAEDWNHVMEKVQIAEVQFFAGMFNL